MDNEEWKEVGVTTAADTTATAEENKEIMSLTGYPVKKTGQYSRLLDGVPTTVQLYCCGYKKDTGCEATVKVEGRKVYTRGQHDHTKFILQTGKLTRLQKEKIEEKLSEKCTPMVIWDYLQNEQNVKNLGPAPPKGVVINYIKNTKQRAKAKGGEELGALSYDGLKQSLHGLSLHRENCSEEEGYIAAYEVDAQSGTFRVLICSRKSIKTWRRGKLRTIDGTYKVNWTNHPLGVLSVSDGSHKNHHCAWAVLSHERGEDYEWVLQKMEDEVKKIEEMEKLEKLLPRKVEFQFDYAGAIFNGVSKAYSRISSINPILNMCSRHAQVAIEAQIEKKFTDKNYVEACILDLKHLMTLIPYPHESAFEFMLKLFLDKWSHANQDLFVEYMNEYWVTPQNGRVHRFGICHTVPGNNTATQGLERSHQTTRSLATKNERPGLILLTKSLLDKLPSMVKWSSDFQEIRKSEDLPEDKHWREYKAELKKYAHANIAHGFEDSLVPSSSGGGGDVTTTNFTMYPTTAFWTKCIRQGEASEAAKEGEEEIKLTRKLVEDRATEYLKVYKTLPGGESSMAKLKMGYTSIMNILKDFYAATPHGCTCITFHRWAFCPHVLNEKIRAGDVNIPSEFKEITPKRKAGRPLKNAPARVVQPPDYVRPPPPAGPPPPNDGGKNNKRALPPPPPPPPPPTKRSKKDIPPPPPLAN